MNTKQKVVLWIGISIVCILLTHPPYEYGAVKWFNFGHRNIITPLDGDTKENVDFTNALRETGLEMKIDIFRLSMEFVLVGIITLGGIWAFKKKENKKITEER